MEERAAGSVEVTMCKHLPAGPWDSELYHWFMSEPSGFFLCPACAEGLITFSNSGKADWCDVCHREDLDLQTLDKVPSHCSRVMGPLTLHTMLCDRCYPLGSKSIITFPGKSQALIPVTHAVVAEGMVNPVTGLTDDELRTLLDKDQPPQGHQGQGV